MLSKLLLVLAALALAPLPGAADTVHLKNGSKLEGRVVSEGDETIEFGFPGGGRTSLSRGDVERIELSDKAAALAEFDRRCKGADANGLVMASVWARFHGMKDEETQALRAALRKDPEHAGAHEALGHRRLDGKWVTEDEFMAASGRVRHGGAWVTPEEKARLEAEAAGKKPAAKEPPAKAPAGDAQAAREWAEALRVVPTWLWAEGKARDDVRKALADRGVLDRPLTKAQAAQLLDRLAAGNPFLTDKTNSGVLEVATGEPGEKTKAWFQLPPGWKPGDKPPGLVIALHGGPAPDYKTAFETAPQEYSYFTSAAAKHGLILASPGWVGDPTPIVLETIETVARRWNVDRSRIFLVGHSAGGVASFMVGPPWADRFAGIAPFVCGIEHGARLKNAWNLPVYHVLGKKDNAFFLDTGRKNSELLRTVGGPLEVVEKEGGHDVYPDECAKSVAWLAARPRNFWSRDVRWHRDVARTTGGLFWIDPLAKECGADFTAKVEGNDIRIAGSRPTEIVLSDKLVDLDKPVAVTFDGEVLFTGIVERTARIALEWVEARRDFTDVPVARVKLDP